MRAKCRQQAGQNDQIDAPGEELIELEVRVADHLRRIEPDCIERHDGHGGGPERPARLPAERRSHHGENKVGEKRARGAFGQVHE